MTWKIAVIFYYVSTFGAVQIDCGQSWINSLPHEPYYAIPVSSKEPCLWPFYPRAMPTLCVYGYPCHDAIPKPIPKELSKK